MIDKKSVTSKISSGSGFESPSVNTIPFEYNVKTHKTTCHLLCTINLFISIILFTCDILFESFIIIQWINNKYYIPTLTLLIFVFISNLGNIYQWYIQFNDTTFKLCHLIIPFGLIGLLPLFSIICYICHSSCCLCARIGIFSNEYNQSISSQHKKVISNHKSNDISERLLQPPPAHSISDMVQINRNKMMFIMNYCQILHTCYGLQSFIRTLPFVCIQLYVFITAKFEPNNLILTHWNNLNININIPNELIINNHSNTYYYISICIGLITYAFITLTCLDLMEKWQQNSFSNIMNKFLKLFHIIFIFCHCIIRIIPIILIFQCTNTIDRYYIIFGIQILWYLEIIIWYEIYQYYHYFPMRKVYPYTYNSLNNKYENIIESTIITHIAMQSQTNKRNNVPEHSDYSSPKQYENPRYIANGHGLNNETDVIILSPVSASTDEINNMNMSMDSDIKDNENDINDSKIWVTKDLELRWKIEKDEYISALQGLFGGVFFYIF